MAPAAAARAPAELLIDANAARLSGRFADAEAGYRAVLAREDVPEAKLGLGLCAAALGRPREAATLLARLLAIDGPLSDESRQRATTALADAKKLVAEVAVKVLPAGATIELDGSDEGQAPLAAALFLDPGAHVLGATLAGRAPAVAHLFVEAGRSYVVELDPSAPAAARRWFEQPRSGEPLVAQPRIDGVFGGRAGAFRAVSLSLSAMCLLGGAAALVVADLNDRALASYLDEAEALGPGVCVHVSVTPERACSRIQRAVRGRSIASTAALGLFSGAAVATTAGLLSLVIAPPPQTSGLARMELSTIASPAGGGLSLEASW
ncbi:MAG: hypothetical protein R3B70_40835 [Polyangiaceae bacterium]